MLASVDDWRAVVAEHMSADGDQGHGYVRRLCERIGRSLEQHVLPVEVFNDEQLFHEESKKLFTRAWVFLGHE